MACPAGEFPSGQRGRAVNPLAQPSEVRILSPPLGGLDAPGYRPAKPGPAGGLRQTRESQDPNA